MVSVLKQIRDHPVYVAGAAGAASMISIALCHSLLGIALLLLILNRRQYFRMPPYWGAIAVFFGGTLVSMAVNGYWTQGLPQVRKFYVWGLLLAIYCFVRTARQARWILLAMAAGGFASALWSMVQFYRKYERATAAGEPFYQAYVGSRITGFTSHWMTFSSDMMIAILIVGALLLFTRRAGWSWKPLAASLGVLALLSLALLLSFTRSVWPATAAGLCALLWLWRPVAVVSLPVLAGLLVVAAPEPLHQRIESVWKPDAKLDSNEHRAVLRRTGREMARANPLFGVGPERVYPRFAEYYPEDAPRPVPVEWYTRHLHNTYVHYAAERGIPTMLALLGFILAAWAYLMAALRRTTAAEEDRRFVLAAAIAIVPGILVGGWWEVNLGDSEVLGCFLSALGCGLAVAATATPQPTHAQTLRSDQ